MLLGAAATARAQRTDTRIPELEGVEITDRSGHGVPVDARFKDENGNEVRLGDYLDRDMPVAVQLVYFGCPMLCTLVLNGFVDGAKGLGWKPGEDYLVLSVSFDPRDTPELALQKKEAYVKSLGIEGAGAGWHFLTGEEDQVRALADSLGFPYRFLEKKGEYAHGAGMFVLTPGGTISRTLYGLSFPEKDLRFSFMEASEGRLGSPLDKVVLFCFRYNADEHGYSLVAVNVMKVGAALTVLFLGTFVVVMWRRERRRAHRAA